MHRLPSERIEAVAVGSFRHLNRTQLGLIGRVDDIKITMSPPTPIPHLPLDNVIHIFQRFTVGVLIVFKSYGIVAYTVKK